MRETLHRLFRDHFGTDPVAIEPIPGQATPRSRFRLLDADGRSAIGVPPGVPEEDRVFLAWSRTLGEAGLPVPALYAVDASSGVCLVEDAGRRSLYDALLDARRRTGTACPDEVLTLFGEALARLPHFQVEGARVVDFDVAWPRAAFDRRAMAWDLAWFKNMGLRLAEIPFHEDRLEDDFETILDALDGETEGHLLHRDFQARNVMLSARGPLFIDFQGGRRGPLAYDVAAMLYSGSSNLPDAARAGLLETYLDALSDVHPVDRSAFRERLPLFAVLRILQALGAYGYRGLHMRRPGFAARMAPAAANLLDLLGGAEVGGDLPEIRRVAARLLAREDLRAPAPEDGDTLVVHVGSFAYPRGLPRDASGHGGGFVFDCRALPNPGREARYRAKTGLDAEVAAVLEASREARTFVARTLDLVDAQVARYRERGYTALDVRFGCTGGQHRSVWCAARLAEGLARRQPTIRVVTEHAEAASWPPGNA